MKARWQDPRERRDLPPVYANVEALKAGGKVILSIRLWEQLPRTWNKKSENERQMWLEEYFRRALNLHDGDQLLTVKVGPQA